MHGFCTAIARSARSAGQRAASALMLILLLIRAADAQSLEAVYVVLGANGPIARAVLAGTTQCPAITIDGAAREMNVRALPDSGTNAPFPILACEMPIPSGAGSASIANSPLPLLKPTLTSVVAFGDTGCRLKAKKARGSATDHEADEDRGKFQDCNNPSLWPFPQVAASAAASKPALIIHVGDYLYRESPCPPGDQGCAGSPHGDDWPSWKADFFAPAAPALRAAPWIVVRGNHESCSRAGRGYFRLLDPTPAQAPPPCIDIIGHYIVTVAGQSFIVLDSSGAADACAGKPCNAAPYAAEFAAMRPPPGTWLLTHRPVWGFDVHRRTINATLQQALAGSNGRLPEGIALALAGHIHVAEVLSFADKRTPQFVLGTGGTLLAGKIKSNLTGKRIAARTVSYGRADHRFGFAAIEPAAQRDRASAVFRDAGGTKLFVCAIGPGEVTCD
jgi:Calcineurin-like phosphoesterase